MALVYGVDVHSEWGPDLTGMIQRHNPEHVVLHTYHGFEAARHRETFKRQVESVHRNGKTVGCYVWAFQGYPPDATTQEAVSLFREAAGHDPPVVWYDLETYDDGSYRDPGPDSPWLRQARLVCQEMGLRYGVYTARWWVDGHFPGGQVAFSEFNDFLLWWANWDRVPELTSPLPLGFTTLHGKQWAVELPGQETIDRDVFLPEVTVPQAASQPTDWEHTAREYAHALRTIRDAILPRLEVTPLRKKDRLKHTAEVRRVVNQYVGGE